MSMLSSTAYMASTQETLFTLAVAAFPSLLNAYGAKALPATEDIASVVLLVGFSAVLMPLWAVAPTISTSEALGSFADYGG